MVLWRQSNVFHVDTQMQEQKNPTDSILLVAPVFIVSGIPLPTIFYILSPPHPPGGYTSP